MKNTWKIWRKEGTNKQRNGEGFKRKSEEVVAIDDFSGARNHKEKTQGWEERSE
jgi:hypothetical protein